MNKFFYKWNLKDGYPAKGIEKHGLKVFSTFACGGGSSMGYKLAGYDVIGANDIDPQMTKVYKENHKPKIFFECPISDLLTKDLPKEMFDLDVLDGSPPCSTFSIAGSREKTWKKNKKFREGQSEQVLSDLFFDWIKLVDRLKPKVAIAENVKGMLLGNAKSYTRRIVQELNKIGYDVQLFLLNASTMGVPQRRERVFFICKRKDLKLPVLSLNFKERKISLKEIIQPEEIRGKRLSAGEQEIWENRRPRDRQFADTLVRMGKKGNRFTTAYLYNNETPPTITASDNNVLFDSPRHLNKAEYCLAGSFPLDYNFIDIQTKYLVGMSVPPIMMAQVSYQVYIQLLSKLRK